jgi:hemerythrin-like domain-containing protein
MEERGFSRAQGPTGVMLAEHDEGRRHIEGMTAALALVHTDQAKARRDFIAHARAYIPLLRQHILKEEHRLFPMANQVFTEGDQRDLLSSFDVIENADDHADIHATYLRLADELADCYDVPHMHALNLGMVCGCGHGT